MTTKEDLAILSRVVDELNWDSRVDSARITAKVLEDVVTLTGSVSSYNEKIAAQEAAHRVLGVRDVANDITVVPPAARTDTEIALAIRHALEWDVSIPHELIQSTVSNGWVTLEGRVPHFYQREDADDAVRRLIGVRGVTNEIDVDPEAIAPSAAHDAIYAALQRQAGREADRVKVDLRDGKLVLSGQVRSWAEKRAAVGAAAHARGVRTVEDRIRVDPQG